MDERKGAQDMYHVLGDTSYLVRGLVFGIRPSIAWRLGVPIPPLDNLTADGHLGWQVGLQSVLRRHRRMPDNTPETVMSWLASQTRPDQQRGAPAAEVVRLLLQCEAALGDDILAMGTEVFVEVWTKNLREANRSRRSARPDPALSELAAVTIRKLMAYPGTESLVSTLHAYCNLADVLQARPLKPLTEVGVSIPSPQSRSFVTAHGLSQSALHPPRVHREDWLEVLAETQSRITSVRTPNVGFTNTNKTDPAQRTTIRTHDVASA